MAKHCLLCMRFGRVRGLCSVHYAHALRLVKSGETTWAELEARGEASKPTVNQAISQFVRRATA